MTIARWGLKVKVIGQGQVLRVKVRISEDGNVIGPTSKLDSVQLEFQFFVCITYYILTVLSVNLLHWYTTPFTRHIRPLRLTIAIG